MIATQYDLFGGTAVAGDVVDKVTHLLESDESCRDSYMELLGQFWLQFDGLDAVLPVEYHEPFLRWLNNGATSPKTVQNRAMEVQRQRPELDASPEVRQLRDRMATQGRVR